MPKERSKTTHEQFIVDVDVTVDRTQTYTTAVMQVPGDVTLIGTAKRNPGDEYDPQTGRDLAVARVFRELADFLEDTGTVIPVSESVLTEDPALVERRERKAAWKAGRRRHAKADVFKTIYGIPLAGSADEVSERIAEASRYINDRYGWGVENEINVELTFDDRPMFFDPNRMAGSTARLHAAVQKAVEKINERTAPGPLEQAGSESRVEAPVGIFKGVADRLRRATEKNKTEG